MAEEARPFVKRLARRHAVASVLGGGSIAETVSNLASIPSDLAHIMSLAKEGRLKIEFEHLGLEKLTNEIERSSNRISFSLLVAALVVASSLILVLGGEIQIYRWFGVAGFAFAAMVGVWLLVNIIRSGRV
jgi:ubiquinone biosynthesis protein